MPEWGTEVRARLAGLRLGPVREAEIVEELSQHLAELCEALTAETPTHTPRYIGHMKAEVSLPALFGSSLLVAAHYWDVMSDGVIWGCVALVFGIRMAAVILDVHAPKPLRTGELT